MSTPVEVLTEEAQPPRVVKPWGIRHVVYGLLLAFGCSTVLTVAVIAVLILGNFDLGAASDPNAIAGQVTSQVAELTQNPLVVLAGLLGLWVGLLGVPIYASYRKGAHSLATDFWFRFDWKRDIPLGVLLAVGLRVADMGLGALGQWVGLSPEDMSNGQFMSGHSLLPTVVLIVAATLAAPVIEELFFRGLTLQAVMRRYGAATGVVVSSLLFGLMHLQSFTAGGLFIVVVTGTLGAVFAITTLRTGRMGAGVVGHVAFNASGVLIMLLAS